MKRSASFFLSLLLAMCLSAAAYAQESFEGSVSYVIRLTGKGAQDLMINEPPTKMDMHIKADNYIINLSGGRIPRTFLFIADSNETYVVDAANRRAFRRTYYEDTTSYVPQAVPTGQKANVKGYDCQEFKVTRTDRKEVILYYVSDQFRVDTTLFEGKKDAKADFLTEGLGGRIPLKKVIKTPDLTTEIELTSIKSIQHDDANFKIPEGFKIRMRDPRY